MNLKALIKDQKIKLDDHYWGAGEIKDWDNQEKDIHLDKYTNYVLNRKKQQVRIKIPLNSDREIKIENRLGKTPTEIPRPLVKEIRKALENKKEREAFVSDLLKTLENFNTILDDKKRIRQVLRRLSKHFELGWGEETITAYTDDILDLYVQNYKNDQGTLSYISISRESIVIGSGSTYISPNRDINDDLI